MNSIQLALITYAFAWVPYLLVAWAYTEFTDGGAKTFWIALAVLVGIRMFFGVIETLGGILTFRLFARKAAINKALETLRDNNFPKRRWADDDLDDYLVRLTEDKDVPPTVQAGAREWRAVLATVERCGGLLVGMRFHAATEAALDIYSPKRDAPTFE